MNEGVIGACVSMRAATSSGFIPDVNDLFESEQKKRSVAYTRFYQM